MRSFHDNDSPNQPPERVLRPHLDGKDVNVMNSPPPIKEEEDTYAGSPGSKNTVEYADPYDPNLQPRDTGDANTIAFSLVGLLLLV